MWLWSLRRPCRINPLTDQEVEKVRIITGWIHPHDKEKVTHITNYGFTENHPSGLWSIQQEENRQRFNNELNR